MTRFEFETVSDGTPVRDKRANIITCIAKGGSFDGVSIMVETENGGNRVVVWRDARYEIEVL